MLGLVAHAASKRSVISASAHSQEPGYVDSCASEHYVRQGDPCIVVGSERSCPAETIETANGDVICSAKVDVDVAGLGRVSGALVLRDGRNLL